jgi:hypothetical protein
MNHILPIAVITSFLAALAANVWFTAPLGGLQ